MSEIDRDTQEAIDLLSVLEPTAVDAPRPAAQALAEVNEKILKEAHISWRYRSTHFFALPGRRYATAVALAAIMLIFAFTFPNVRAAASEFLSLFRVQNITAITISPEQIAVLQAVAEQGLTPGEVEIINDPGELTLVDSIGEAEAMTGVTPVRTIGSLTEPEAIYVSSAGNGRFTIDLEGSRAIVEAVGVDPLLLPDELDGAQVYVAVFAGVAQEWDNDLLLLQSESPLVEYPDGLDTAVLGQALLQVLGLDEEEAIRLSQEIDWASTLLLPIPQDIATYQEVTVDGVSGMAISDLDGRAATILWQKDGIIYTLFGERGVEELVALANSLE